MKSRAPVQAKFAAAFDRYLALTALLRSDLEGMLDAESTSAHWRRNFVRASVALLEGHAYSLRRLCRVLLPYCSSILSAKERKAIARGEELDTSARLKLTLRAAYKIFDLKPLPNFGDKNWTIAQGAVRKRHRLMHPRHVHDLGMSAQTWRIHKRGIVWLMEQFFDFMALAKQRYGS